MFFHHPDAEANLQRMAANALRGASMEPTDRRWWPRIKAVLKFIGWESMLAMILCLLAGLRDPRLGTAMWRDFMLAGAVLLTTRLSGHRFYWQLQSSPTVNVLWHLPVPGRDICRWGRGMFLRDTLVLLPRMMVAAWAWQGFPAPADAWLQIVGMGVLLWIVMTACVMHDSATQGMGNVVVKAWSLALLVWVVLALYAWWFEKNHHYGQALPGWITALCAPASWLLPAKWAVHAAHDSTALMLTLACIVSGGFMWWRFPDKAAIAYDRLFPDRHFETPGNEADDFSGEDATEEIEQNTSTGVLVAIQHARENESTLIHEGWIEKLALLLLRGRDRETVAILTGTHAGWTRRWWQAVMVCVLLLLTAYVLVNFGSRWIKLETLEAWIIILPLAAVAGLAFPVSNAIPVATCGRPLGNHAMPFFAGLPVSVSDLLRVSRRITIARMAACLVLVLPVVAAQCFILGHERGITVLFGIALALALLWIMIRPMFIYYRLQQMSSPARRFRFEHLAAYLIILPLGLGVMTAGVACVASVALSPAWVLVGACCAQGIYAVFLRRVKTRRVDWISRG